MNISKKEEKFLKDLGEGDRETMSKNLGIKKETTIDFYLNGEIIDPKRIEIIEGKIYLDGIAFINEWCEYVSPEHPSFKCVLINFDDKY